MSTFPKLAEGWEANKENQDLTVPIPFDSLGINTANDLKVTLVHRWFSPPSAAVRCILNYYGVQQERINMEMPFKGNISASPYKQVPQVVVMPKTGQEDKGGYLVCDSWVIMKQLYPVLHSVTVDQDVGSDDALKEAFGKVTLALMTKLTATTEGPSQFARHFMSPDASRDPLSKVLCQYFVGSKMDKLRKKFPETFVDKMKWFMEQIQNRKTPGGFFSKTKDPGPVDLAVYGCLTNGMIMVDDKVVNQDKEGVANWIRDDIKEAGAEGWYNAVDAAYKAKGCEPVIPDEVRDKAASSLWGWW